jgi:serine protease
MKRAACIALIMLAAATPALAIITILPPAPRVATELHNAITGHYFVTASASELADIDAGRAGPGWGRTGHGFEVYAPNNEDCFDYDCGAQIQRFYGRGPNSHVFTGDPAEAAQLARPGTGWQLEGQAFRVPVPEPGGCRAGYAPVIRFYNNRFAENDSNHRYVTSESERMAMRARGWIEEGVAFCSTRAVHVPR